MSNQQNVSKPDISMKKRLTVLFALVGALMVPVLLFFGYDLLKSSIFPCEAIFEQAGTSLNTKIKFLGAEGEVYVGKEKLQDLGERAQMTAQNLKTCCTVLDAGKINPEEFLQCKASARKYEADVDNLVSLVRAAVAAETDQLADRLEEAVRDIASTVEVARETSRAFNQRIVGVRKQQAVAQLEATPPKHVEVEAQEREPNNDILNTNIIELDTWITGAIAETSDNDYYAFTTPDFHRDIIRIEIENRSTTLRPALYLYNANKAYMTHLSNETTGANLAHQFVAGPKAKHYVQIRNYDRRTLGAYLVRILPLRAYDTFEPNQTILQAKPISFDTPVKAGIMDRYDNDNYRVETCGAGGTMVISLENRSTTLKPALYLYDANKTYMTHVQNGTRGANLSYQFTAVPDSTYHVRIRNYDGRTAGDYTLNVTLQ